MKNKYKLMLLMFVFNPILLKAQVPIPGISDWRLGGNPFAGPAGTIISNYFGTDLGNAQGVRMGTVGVSRMFMQGTAGVTTGFIGIGNDFTNPQSRLHLYDLNQGNMFRTDGPAGTENNWTLFTGTAVGGAFGTERFKLFVRANESIVRLQATQANTTVIQRPGTLGSSPNSALTFNVGNATGSERMRITHTSNNPLETFKDHTRVGISVAPPFGIPTTIENPLTALHIGSDAAYDYGGHRTWMDVGTYYSYGGTDNMYVGLKQSEEFPGHFDRMDAIINWGDNNYYGPIFPDDPPRQYLGDHLRIVFTANQPTGTGKPHSLGGIEVARFTPFGNVGIGNGFSSLKEPIRRLEILEDELLDGDQPQFRLTHTKTNNSTASGIFVDFQATGLGDLAIFPFNGTTARRVGIGIVNPANTLDINGDLRIRQIANNDALTRVLVAETNGEVKWRDANSLASGVSANNGLSKNTSTNVQLGQLIGAAGNPAQLISDREIPLNGYNLVFTGSNIDQSINNVGIGTTTPLAKLDVYNDNGSVGASIGANYIGIRTTVIGNTVPPPVGQRNTGVLVRVTGEHSTEYGVRVTADGFGTSNFGVLAYADQANGENVGVKGLASGLGGGTHCGVWGEVLNCGGVTSYGVYGKACRARSSYAGYFDGDVVVTGTLSPSDQMFKINVDTIANVKNIISQLKPKTYFYDTVTYEHFNFSSKKQYGLIAQHVETVLPELVKTGQHMPVYDSTGTMIKPAVTYKELNYNAFFAILIAGMQKQQEIIEKQQASIDTLKSILGITRVNGGSGSTTTSYVKPQNITLSNLDALVLDQNVPNPFEENTLITYRIPENIQNAYIIFYDQNGRVINKADITTRGEGKLQVYGSQLSKSIYTYSLVADSKVIDTKKMVKQ